MAKTSSAYPGNDFEERARSLVSFTEAWRGDEALRSRAEANPHAALAEHGVDVPSGHDVRIVANTAEAFHLIMPPDPNADLADEDLDAVAGGKTAAVGMASDLLVSSATASTAGVTAAGVSGRRGVDPVS